MWKCAYCGHREGKRPRRTCPGCGLVLAGLGTNQKYRILEKYCHSLSLIMRNQGFKHYFIDACAGSGVIQALNSKRLTDGSPLIMAKTKEWVENKIRDKSKEPSVKCVFIEQRTNTFEILKKATKPYNDFVELHKGDCNKLLSKMLSSKLSSAFKPFLFVYIDPFGLGDPIIKYDTVREVMGRDYTELFIHFSWEGVSRMAGHLKNVNHPDPNKRKVALSNVKSLNNYMTDEWQRIQESNPPSHKKREKIVRLYERMLKDYYPGVQHIEIPVGSSNPSYYLFYTTRNRTGRKIMKEILDEERRKGARLLDEFM